MADIVDIAVKIFLDSGDGCSPTSLVDTLKSPGPLLFCTQMTMPLLNSTGTIQTLAVNNIPQLTRILTYHVVPGKLMKAELAKLGSVISVEGSPIKIDCSDGFEVKKATVVAPDIVS